MFHCVFHCAFFAALHSAVLFFSSSLADVALRLGPYMSISCRKDVCTRTQLVHMSRQIEVEKPKKTHKTTKPRRPANPPARLAFRQRKQQNNQNNKPDTKKRGRSPNTTPTKSICQGTQWFDHCISLKNMRQK